MRDLSSSTWVIPRFLGKRVIKGTLSIVVVFRNTLQLDVSAISPGLDICLCPLASPSSQKLWHRSGTNVSSPFVNFGLLHWGE